MKRSHSLLALGAAVIGILALASFTAPPRTPVNLLPVPIFTVVVKPSTTPLPLVTPTSIALPSAIPNTPTTIAFATSPAPLPTFTMVVTSVPSIASTETAIPANTESPPIQIPQPSDAPALTPTPLPFTSTPPVPTPTHVPTSTSTSTPIPLTEATLLRVIDGDTLEVSFANRTERVRLIGTDSPETNGPPICFGQEATTHAQQLLAPSGGKIWLEKDISETDKYDRLLRYVWLDLAQTRMFDEAMVADGFAQVSTYPPDVKYESRFLLAQRTAQASSRGLWGACLYFGAPLPTPTPTSPVLPTEPPPAASTPASQGDLPYDPNGPDRDCSDFATHDEAQRFFIAAGGPANDPHRLDGDHDGIACETLP